MAEARKKIYTSKTTRDFPRAQAMLQVRFRLLVPEASRKAKKSYLKVYQATTSDLGTGGLAILCKRSLRLGSMVELDLILDPKGSQVKSLTRVVWTKKVSRASAVYYRAGLRFLAMHDRNVKKITEFILASPRTR